MQSPKQSHVFTKLASLVFLLLSILLGSSGICSAQILFSPALDASTELSPKQERIVQRFENDSRLLGTKLVRLSAPVGKISENESISVPTFGGSFLGTVTEVVRRDRDTTLVVRVGDSATFSVIVVNGDMITGQIRHDDQQYEYEPLGDGLHLIVHHSSLSATESGRSMADHVHQAMRQVSDDLSENSDQLNIASTTDYIEVLSLYTTKADDAVADVESKIQAGIQDANQILSNHGLYPNHMRFHNRHTAWLDYTELWTTGYWGDEVLDDLVSPDSLPAVHTMRDDYGADIVLTVINLNQSLYFGLADETGGGEDDAFVIIEAINMTKNYVIAHELGHILGAGHENCCSPYTYGEPFADDTNEIYSVIAGSQMGSGGTLAPYYSDPGVTFQGVVIGNATTEDNSRVVEENSSTVAAFRADPTLVASISGPTSVQCGVQETWEASSTGGNGDYVYTWYSRPPSGSWSVEAYNIKYFNETFYGDVYIKVKSQSALQTDDATSYVSASGQDCTYKISSGANDPELASEFVLSPSYPNPFNPTTTISFSIPERVNVSVEVYNMLGTLVETLVDRNLSSGSHSVEWNAHGQGSGAYLLRVKAGEEENAHLLYLLK